MDGFEKAIRAALAKGDTEDRPFREKVYLSALAALEKSIRAQSDMEPAAAEKRRQYLRLKIRDIESEFRPAVEPSAPEPHARAVEIGTPPSTSAPDFTSELQPPRRDDAALAPEAAPTRVFSRRRRPFAWLLVAALLLSFVGIGYWWVQSSDILLSLSERDGSVANPPQTVDTEDFQPAGTETLLGTSQVPQEGTWITIFSPDDPTTVIAPTGTSVSVEGDGDEKAMRIVPSAPDSLVLFDIGQGILDQMAGNRVTFDITASSEDGEDTQMSVRCNFAELGDCDRKRYIVEPTRNEFLFEVELPDNVPGSAGSIALTPDISEGKRAIRVYEIKVLVPKS